MTVPAPARKMWLDYLPAISLAILLFGAAQAGGGIIAQMKDNTRRIEHLEKDAREDAKARTEMLQSLDTRLARIEVKLELMAPAKDKAP